MQIVSKQVEDFLRGQLDREAEAVTPINHGEWSKAFSFRDGAAEYVIRFSAIQDDFLKDQRAMSFAGPNLPVPRILEIGTALGGFYALAERATGTFLDDLRGDALRRVLPSLWLSLDAMREVDISATSGYGKWDGHGRAAHPSWRAALLDVALDRPTDRVHGWRAKLAASPTGLGPFEEGFACLESLVEVCPEDRYLLHADLVNFNVLTSNDRVSTVLDWGCGMYGDFLYEVAWLTFWQPWNPAWNGIDIRGEVLQHCRSTGLAVPHFEERLRCYEICIGLEHLAYNAFKERWDQLEAVSEHTLRIVRESHG